MNKEYIYIDGKVIVEDEKGNKKVGEYTDKTEEILIRENLIETMENRIKELEKELSETKENNKPYIPVIVPAVIFSFAVFAPILFTLLGIDITAISSTIFGPMNEFLLTTLVVGSLTLPLATLMELQLYRQDKHAKNSRRGDVSEYEYLTEQIIVEKEILEELKLEQTKTHENKEFEVKKVDDLETLKILRSHLNLYNDLGYNVEKYYKYLEQGKLEEKLKEYYNEYGIKLAKEYLEEKGKTFVKKRV